MTSREDLLRTMGTNYILGKGKIASLSEYTPEVSMKVFGKVLDAIKTYICVLGDKFRLGYYVEDDKLYVTDDEKTMLLAFLKQINK